MISTTSIAPALPPGYSAIEDGARGLEYSAQVLETGGNPNELSASEAPQLLKATSGRAIPLADLQAQIDDSARILAADPASAPVVQRVRDSQNALLYPPPEPISNSMLNIVATVAGIVGILLGILPAFGILVSPWLIVGVLGVSLGTFLVPFINQFAAGRARDRAVAEHEAAILALVQRADELRLEQQRQAAQARPAAHVTLDAPTSAPQ